MKSILFLLPVLLVCGALTAQGLIIPAGAYVTGGNAQLVMHKNWTNNGSFTANSSTVVFAGNTQTINGSSTTTFNNISIASGSNTSVATSNQFVKNTLLSNGTLNANGLVTLLSGPTQTAAIDGSGIGEVLGNITVQRYLAAGFGYKYVSSPFQAATVNEFANEINLAAIFPAFYKHDENQSSNGWITYTGSSSVLSPMRGYAANLGAATSPVTIDMTGVVNNHNLSISLSNNNKPYTQGFNLVGNPYPSPINWDAPGGWTKTNIDNAVYFFNAGGANQYTGVYSSYINGVSSNGSASNIIAAMQGFFVHVTAGSFPVAGLLGINNNARIINNNASFFRVGGGEDKMPLLRLQAALPDISASTDPVVVYFTDNASNGFEATLDALKLMNTDSLTPSIYAVAAEKENYLYRHWPWQAIHS
ncbi:MAG TPA: hypothetical protein VL307_20330 [Chitinophagaceae bacterium]|nr:hypothetical protein [Chitinophagaceae bacterium]